MMIDTSGWNMSAKYRRRRAVTFTVAIAVGLFMAYFIATNVWWTGSSYCVGSDCLLGGG
jgi:hypothetical protein